MDRIRVGEQYAIHLRRRPNASGCGIAASLCKNNVRKLENEQNLTQPSKSQSVYSKHFFTKPYWNVRRTLLQNSKTDINAITYWFIFRASSTVTICTCSRSKPRGWRHAAMSRRVLEYRWWCDRRCLWDIYCWYALVELYSRLCASSNVRRVRIETRAMVKASELV